jgi:hypothetical protein
MVLCGPRWLSGLPISGACGGGSHFHSLLALITLLLLQALELSGGHRQEGVFSTNSTSGQYSVQGLF